MADLVLFLGDFEFKKEEVPERIAIGGEQRLVTRELVGGLKQVHAMGASADPIEWRGWFRGPDALERGRYLDTLRVQGNQLTLVWSEFVYTVLIRRFAADFERYYQLPYTIVLEVVEDLSQPVRSQSAQSIDSLISGDMLSAGGLVESLGMPSITSLYADVQSAIGTVSSFANAAQSTLNSVLQPIAALRNEALTLAATVNNTLVNVTTVGGILPNNPIAQQVQKISSQIVAAQQLPALIALDRTMGRVQGNIGSIYNSAKRQTVAGANLMDMASKIYGDAMAWTGIAKANGMTDPQVAGAAELTIPPTADKSGGVLNS
ncbi:hypothetical protein [Cupriavidus pauculus]|uniref:Uncharacterized protein n=1 Tax=Cupriavidus pauculus TaxID=82633 RepID=A0A3G8H479_9BURK|nr:hypothetical protein [Cupriavidus pauculus]AZG14930.1 hypothetical protein EHF44_16720 [Cupriavidus pauculus]